MLHVDSTWEFRSLIEFRDRFAQEHGFELVANSNDQGRSNGINPFDHGVRYTAIMRTESLKNALAAGGYDIIFGGARRDEENSRAANRRRTLTRFQHFPAFNVDQQYTQYLAETIEWIDRLAWTGLDAGTRSISPASFQFSG